MNTILLTAYYTLPIRAKINHCSGHFNVQFHLGFILKIGCPAEWIFYLSFVWKIRCNSEDDLMNKKSKHSNNSEPANTLIPFKTVAFSII